CLAAFAVALAVALAVLQPALANGVGTIFVVNERSNSVSVLEHINNSVLSNIPVGAGPHAIAFTDDGQAALVANRGAGSISVIDRDTYAVSATTRVGGTIESVAVPADSSFTLAADSDANRIAVVDAAGATKAEIATPG